jgi:hypothetical protein
MRYQNAHGRRWRRSAIRLLVGAGLATVPSAGARAQQPLETETARLPPRGELQLSVAYEYQRSSEGTERALPLAMEIGIASRLALLVEPVLYTSIRPRTGASATGLGDLEATLEYMTSRETQRQPAIALAAEVKFPTARSSRIGTGRADFTPYLILSKTVGHAAIHANVGYSFVGRPQAISVQNTVNLAVAVEQHVSNRWTVMAEILSTSASVGGGEGTAVPNAPELAGAEQTAMVGLRYRSGSRSMFSLGVTYDNTNAVLVRPGITIVLP